MIIDGKSIAENILKQCREDAARLSRTPSFAAIAIEPSSATESYLRIKKHQAKRAGIEMEMIVPEAATTESLLELIANDTHDALIVQLPLPESIDTARVLAAIPPEKDADVLSLRTREARMLVHPIVAAVSTILDEADVSPAGMHSLVIGKGWLVGQPVSAWLAAEGANVTVVTREAGDFSEAARHADLIVSGAGVAGLLKPEHVKDGAVVIDVGTSELGGSLAGDADPQIAEKAAVFTPVPGGVGPVAVACLMRNVVKLAAGRDLQQGENPV
ncbi:MAG TPA: bifunctional 5,10-methylenetetrahydrofolate dehydrogenase/5,10-methenyltetrahydrofolate cyclohydrolase [Candidatus Paceibacterota bacterium]|nr:bifunctional 5,10-methylenetetrahydrofolate dehydrogenase/5,10-methenyltetrahydrofolate cyclohydrolase [Candidatus Paceibacterota bacterium]